MNNGKVYYSEIFNAETVTTGFLVVEFYNICDLGDIFYNTGFIQYLWFRAEPMEMTFPTEITNIQNGEGRNIPTFTRQTKKYNVKTLEMPSYMVEVFNRMKLHDTIMLTDLVGDTNEVFNLEIIHDWLFEDKYYSAIALTFDYDETFTITGCCNNIM